jgi:arylsulfatase A-like enzyme
MLPLSLPAQNTGNDAKAPPNIILINIDDMGYADPSCYGTGYARTPMMDKLASEGVRFSDYYVTQAVCGASRASLLTGCYANRVGLLGAPGPDSKSGIHEQETTIAEMLKQQGYATAVFGKWHLGSLDKFLPLNHGFDEYLGLPYSNDMIPENGNRKHYPPLPLIEGTRVTDTIELAEQENLTHVFTQRAVRFIREHHSGPFFLYLAHSMVHVPLAASTSFRGISGHSLYQDVLLELDYSLGVIIGTVEELELTGNTLIILTSDNGPWLSAGVDAGRADPLREGKGTAWEGGVRVPCIMKWPALIPAGSVCTAPCMNIDILPTLAELTGSPLPALTIDGKSIVPLLKDPEHAAPPHDALFFYYGKKLNAIRMGDWKLHLPHSYTSLAGRAGGDGWHHASYDILYTDTALYNLRSDIGERQDVHLAHPDVVRIMSGLADSIKQLLGDQGMTGSEVRLPGFAEGFISEPRKVKHAGVGMSVYLENEPSPSYPGSGASTLTDGIIGTQQFDSRYWLGFAGKDLVAVIDLGKQQRVDSVVVSALQDIASWIFFPSGMEAECSSDRSIFTPAGRLTIPPPDQDGIRQFGISTGGIRTRYLRIKVKNKGTCPEGHPGAGQAAWLFAGEIIVK